MDIRNRDFHFQLCVNGVAKPINMRGSVTKVANQLLQELLRVSSKANLDGERFVLRCGDRAFGESKATESDHQRLANDVWASLDSNPVAQQQLDESQPRPDESFEEFYQRLVNSGDSPTNALWFACDWFGREQDPELVGWLADSKVKRFIELNTRNTAFESALPSEYAELKHYVLHRYPNLTKNLKFRVA